MEEVADNIDRIHGHAGLSQRTSDFAMFGTEGRNGVDGFYRIDNTSGVASLVADDIGTEEGRGRAITFVGGVLYYAVEQSLYNINSITGNATLLRPLVIDQSSFPESPTAWNISSMTTRPESGVIYGTLRERSVGDEYFVTIDPNSGSVTNLASMGEREYHGITWIPADYINE